MTLHGVINLSAPVCVNQSGKSNQIQNQKLAQAKEIHHELVLFAGKLAKQSQSSLVLVRKLYAETLPAFFLKNLRMASFHVLPTLEPTRSFLELKRFGARLGTSGPICPAS